MTEQPSVEALVERIKGFGAVLTNTQLAALDSLTAALERERELRLHEAQQRDRNFESVARLDAERAAAEARAQKAEAELSTMKILDRNQRANRAEAQLAKAEAVVEAARYECEHLGGSEGLLNAVARYDAPPTV